MSEPLVPLAEVAAKLKIGAFHRHVFLCIGNACCTSETGHAAWEALKRELKDRNLSLAEGPAACYRTKVQCLRVCSGGPIVVVYPEGTWYHRVDEAKMERIIQNHLIHGKPLLEEAFVVDALGTTKNLP